MLELLKNRTAPLCGAHRGASRYFPENTKSAFQEAVVQGCDYIELDVHLSRDEVPVIIHNETVDETTNGCGYVKNFTLEELQSLGILYEDTPETIPSLEEILIWAKNNTYVSIELKTAGMEEAVLAVIERTNMREQVQVMSFDHHAVKRIKTLDPDIVTSIIFAGRLIDIQGAAAAAKADIINAPPMFLTEEDVYSLHSNGYFICGSMSDNPKVWQTIIDKNIDMIDTNIPADFQAFQNEKLVFHDKKNDLANE